MSGAVNRSVTRSYDKVKTKVKYYDLTGRRHLRTFFFFFAFVFFFLVSFLVTSQTAEKNDKFHLLQAVCVDSARQL